MPTNAECIGKPPQSVATHELRLEELRATLQQGRLWFGITGYRLTVLCADAEREPLPTAIRSRWIRCSAA